MKQILGSLLVLLALFNSANGFSRSGRGTCLKTRGALDIGSAKTRVNVSIVDRCSQTIVREIYSSSVKIAYLDNFKPELENGFSDEFLSQVENSMQKLFAEMKSKLGENLPPRFLAVATEAMRQVNAAGKQSKILEILEPYASVRIIDPDIEGKLGFIGALGFLPTVHSQFVNFNHVYPSPLVWDIGAGSAQFSSYDQNILQLKVAKSKLASNSFRDLISTGVFRNSAKKPKSPNPLIDQNGNEESLELAKSVAKVAVAGELAKMGLDSEFGASKRVVIGVGGVHNFSVLGQLKRKKEMFYTLEHIENLIQERARLTDEELKSEYADSDVTNLILVAEYMRAMGIDSVYTVDVNNTHGALVYPEFWPK